MLFGARGFAGSIVFVSCLFRSSMAMKSTCGFFWSAAWVMNGTAASHRAVSRAKVFRMLVQGGMAVVHELRWVWVDSSVARWCEGSGLVGTAAQQQARKAEGEQQRATGLRNDYNGDASIGRELADVPEEPAAADVWQVQAGGFVTIAA